MYKKYSYGKTKTKQFIFEARFQRYNYAKMCLAENAL